jgi:hypothetical protein
MNGMPARQHVGRFYGIKQIFQADGAVGVEPFSFAQMIQGSNACSAHVTVHKIIVAFYPTNSAFIAMIIISLNSVIKKVAHGTKIGRELDATLKACLRDGLFFIALVAHDFFDFVPIHCMRLCFIVAVTACILFAATRGH